MSDAVAPEVVHRLLDLDNVCILTGTGLAKACGGFTMKEVTEQMLVEFKKIKLDQDVEIWKKKCLDIENPNFEQFFNLAVNKQKYLSSVGKKDADLEKVINSGKKAVFDACQYNPSNIQAQKLFHFLQCLTERKTGLSRVNIFSLNYDLLIETAADQLGIIVNDGFEGSVRRVFRPAVFDLDYFYPTGVVSSRPSRCERVVNLIKLHGSVNWQMQNGRVEKAEPNSENMFIYPSQDKLQDTLMNPFSEAFRRFSIVSKRYKMGLLVIGYGFLDSHVNNILLQALEQAHSFMIVVNPNKDCWKGPMPELERFIDKVKFIPENFENFCDKYLPQSLVSDPSNVNSSISEFLKFLQSENTNREMTEILS